MQTPSQLSSADRPRSGLSVVEVLVALMIVSIGLLGIAGSTALAMRTTFDATHRLSPARFVVAVDCQVGPDNAVLARRRLQLLLDRPTRPDSTAPILPPAPIRRWSLTDLY